MPRETIQFPSVDGTIATETSVRWTREEIGGHVQLSIQRYPTARVCINGCDGVNTGCSSCPPNLAPEDAATRAVIGTSQILSSVLVGEKSESEDDEIDPTKMQPSHGAFDGRFGSVEISGEPVVVAGPPRVSLGGAYVLPPIDDCELAAPQPDGSAIMWSDPLDRRAINKLIKALRRARDQAYGQDE